MGAKSRWADTTGVTRIQAVCRGVATRAAVVAAVRADYLELCERLNAGAPSSLGTRPRWASPHLCAPRFVAAPPPAPAPAPRPAPTPPKPRKSPGSPSPPPSPTAADVQRELDWARAALRSRLAYLERDPFQLDQSSS